MTYKKARLRVWPGRCSSDFILHLQWKYTACLRDEAAKCEICARKEEGNKIWYLSINIKLESRSIEIRLTLKLITDCPFQLFYVQFWKLYPVFYTCYITWTTFFWQILSCQKREEIFPECGVEELEEPGLQPLPSSLAILKCKIGFIIQLGVANAENHRWLWWVWVVQTVVKEANLSVMWFLII